MKAFYKIPWKTDSFPDGTNWKQLIALVNLAIASFRYNPDTSMTCQSSSIESLPPTSILAESPVSSKT